MTRLDIVTGDITQQPDVDVIVNAANAELRTGSGVCGAIMRAGGWMIEQECMAIGSCPTGDAVLTGAGDLPNSHVVHAVGPIYQGDGSDAKLLASCHRRAVERAAEAGAKSIAFPAISCGVYGYPIHDAAHISVEAALEAAQEHGLDVLRFVLFSEEDRQVFLAVAEHL